jgi:hypothetical protein
MLRAISFLICVLLLLSLAGCSSPKPDFITVEVSAGDASRRDCPIAYELPAAIAESSSFELSRADTGASVPAQRLAGEPARLAWILEEPLAAGETRRYHLRPLLSPLSENPVVTSVDSPPAVTIRIGDKPVLVYNKATLQPPDGADPVFARSGFIHPLYTPSGNIVTDDFPPDHFHQHGLFFAWVNTTFERRNVDFWNQAERKGDVEHLSVTDVRSGDVFAELVVVLRHLDKSAVEGPKAALEETWTVRVYNVADPFLIDFISEQRTAGASALTVNDYHYGGMAIRGARQWTEHSGSDMLTSEGKHRIDGNHTRPNWVEIYGPVDGTSAGAVLMGATDNFRYPQPVRLHPSMPYFCFAPMVAGEFRIDPGQVYRSRYRIAVHDGPPNRADNDRIWSDYAEGPTVRLID